MSVIMKPVILVACGSFNPPTIMHLRLFELAKDLLKDKQFHVLGGIISPTHDEYKKKGLLPATHRLEMVKLALEDYPFVKLSRWETEQDKWTPTREALDAYQQQIRDFLSGSLPRQSWMPDGLDAFKATDNAESFKLPKLLFVCGADLLETFSVPGLWKPTDIEMIVKNHGLAVITREGFNPLKYIYEHDTLFRHQENIHIATERIPNLISSTSVRLAVRRGHSIRFIVPSKVIEYIGENDLYLSANENDIVKSEYSCMLPSQTYYRQSSELSHSTTQTSTDTIEISTQTRPKAQVEITTQTNSPSKTFEMETQTNVSSSEITTQTIVLSTEMTTQTKMSSCSESTTQTVAPLTKGPLSGEIPTQTSTIECSEITTQTRKVESNEMTTQTKIATLEIQPIPIKVIPDTEAEKSDLDEQVCEQCEACLCGDRDGDSKAEEVDYSYSCSSECSSCSCLDPSNTSANCLPVPPLDTDIPAEPETETEPVPECQVETSRDVSLMANEELMSEEVQEMPPAPEEAIVVCVGGEGDKPATDSQVNLNVKEEASIGDTPSKKEKKRSDSRARVRHHRGEISAAGVHFEITADGVRVISDKESFL